MSGAHGQSMANEASRAFPCNEGLQGFTRRVFILLSTRIMCSTFWILYLCTFAIAYDPDDTSTESSGDDVPHMIVPGEMNLPIEIHDDAVPAITFLPDLVHDEMDLQIIIPDILVQQSQVLQIIKEYVTQCMQELSTSTPTAPQIQGFELDRSDFDVNDVWNFIRYSLFDQGMSSLLSSTQPFDNTNVYYMLQISDGTVDAGLSLLDPVNNLAAKELLSTEVMSYFLGAFQVQFMGFIDDILQDHFQDRFQHGFIRRQPGFEQPPAGSPAEWPRTRVIIPDQFANDVQLVNAVKHSILFKDPTSPYSQVDFRKINPRDLNTFHLENVSRYQQAFYYLWGPEQRTRFTFHLSPKLRDKITAEVTHHTDFTNDEIYQLIIRPFEVQFQLFLERFML